LLKEAAIWYFGESAGLDFNSEFRYVNWRKAYHKRSCATISDKDEITFYTDGSFVYNKNHKIMANGYGVENKSSTRLSWCHSHETHMFIIFSP
jgi:hypothetical protein